MRVRRGAVPVLLWCLATTASIGVASLALRPVLRTAIPQDSVPVAADGQGGREAVPQTLPPPSVDSPAPAPTVIADPGSASSPPSSVAPHPHTSGAAPTTAGARPATATTTATTAAAPARSVDGWTVTTGSDGIDVYLRSFRTDGGDAVIRIRDGVVSVVTATPRDGYSVAQSQTAPTRLLVQFISASGNSAWLVDCMWWQNGPHGEVTRIGT
ncbi:DNA mismatch repair protein MutL [Dactylosporangium sp. NPDC051485]|uniref:DNA mismatch repair protein MutL n=1 Tax=Dactylosporangium sp. NPDC051485 TaxID=3154846 RepID=UPI00342A009B